MKNLTSLTNLYSIHNVGSLGGGSGINKPPILTNLIGHYAELVNSGVNKSELTNGDVITQWDDLSGNDRHFTSANNPTYNETLKSITLNGTNQYLRNAEGVPLSNEMTIFLVTTPSTVTNSYVISDEGNNFAILSKFDNGGVQDFEVFGKVQRSSFITSTTTGLHILSFKVSNTDTLQYGSCDSEPNIYNEVDATLDGGYTLKSIGNSKSSGSNWAGVDVCELLIYDRPLTQDEILKTETYLSSKYGITLWTPDTYPEENLVGYYKLDYDGYDEFNTNNLISENVEFELGKINNSLRLVSSDSRLKSIDNTTFEFERTDSFSFSFWVKFNSISTNTFILSKGNSASPFNGYHLYFDGNSKLVLYLKDDADNIVSVGCNSSFETNKWYHLVYTYNGSSTQDGIKVYSNGVNVTEVITSSTLTGSIKGDWLFNIGNRDNDNVAINGYIDELAVYDKVLSFKEVYTLYNFDNGMTYKGEVVFPEDAIKAYYKFDDDATDQVGYADLTETDITYSTGIIENGVEILNDTSVLTVSDNTLFDFDRTDAFSIGFWMKRNSTSQGHIMFKFDENITLGYMIEVSDNSIVVRMFSENMNNGSIQFNFVDSKLEELNTFHYYALTYDGSSSANGFKFYIDGVEITNKNISFDNLTATIKNSINVIIGNSGQGNKIDGILDEFGVWDRALESYEVRNLYNEGNGLTYEGSSFEFNFEYIAETTEGANTNYYGVAVSSNGTFLVDGGNKYIYKWDGSNYVKFQTLSEYVYKPVFIDDTRFISSYGPILYEFNVSSGLFELIHKLKSTYFRSITVIKGYPLAIAMTDDYTEGIVYNYETNTVVKTLFTNISDGDIVSFKTTTIPINNKILYTYSRYTYPSGRLYINEYDIETNDINQPQSIYYSDKPLYMYSTSFSETGQYLFTYDRNSNYGFRVYKNNGDNTFSTYFNFTKYEYYRHRGIYVDDKILIVVEGRSSASSVGRILIFDMDTKTYFYNSTSYNIEQSTTLEFDDLDIDYNKNFFASKTNNDDRKNIIVFKINGKFNGPVPFSTVILNEILKNLNGIYTDNSLTLLEKIEKIFNFVVDIIQGGNYTEEQLNNMIDWLQSKKENQPQDIIDRINDIIEMLVDALV